jgi:hypothetical protein
VFEARVVFSLLYGLNLLGVVLGVGVAEEAAIGGLAEPVVAGLQLIVEVSVVVLLALLSAELLGVGRVAAEREGPARVFVGVSDVLVDSVVAGELRGVGADAGGGTVAVEEVLGVRSVELVSGLAFEGIAIAGAKIEVIALEFVVFLVVVHQVGDELLSVVAALVGRVFGEVGLHRLQRALVPAAVAVLAEALVVVVLEVELGQLEGRLREEILFGLALAVVVAEGLRADGLGEGAVDSVALLVFQDLLEVALVQKLAVSVRRNRVCACRGHSGSSNNFIISTLCP